MIELELDELGPPTEFVLSPDEGRLLAASGVVTAVPSLYAPGRWLVGPAGKVGAARVGNVVVRIRPKVEISRLLFMLGYSLHDAAWQASTVDVGEALDLVPAIAQALWRQVSRAIHQGLLPGYVTCEESSLVLRGRLLESAQLARHHGQPLPLEISYDEFTVDIPENQILRTACERMLLVPRVDAGSSRVLRRVLGDFVDVRSIRRGDPVPVWQPTRINARYHAALRLAELVLRATSVEHTAGSVAVNGFLLNMAQLFEDFVTVALREAIEASYGGTVVGQSSHHLDEAGRVLLKPDMVWHVDGKTAAVIDAKYKAEKPSGFPNADIYQLLAYCTALGLRTGFLVYAAGNEQPTRYVICQVGIEIICYALNLSEPPNVFLAQIGHLASVITAASRLCSCLLSGRCCLTHNS